MFKRHIGVGLRCTCQYHNINLHEVVTDPVGPLAWQSRSVCVRPVAAGGSH